MKNVIEVKKVYNCELATSYAIAKLAVAGGDSRCHLFVLRKEYSKLDCF